MSIGAAFLTRLHAECRVGLRTFPCHLFSFRGHVWMMNMIMMDSAYWVYLVHLPVVVGLQIAFANCAVTWWIKWPLINAIAFPVLLLSYHWLVRLTWISAWLNGRRSKMKSKLPPGQGGTESHDERRQELQDAHKEVAAPARSRPGAKLALETASSWRSVQRPARQG